MTHRLTHAALRPMLAIGATLMFALPAQALAGTAAVEGGVLRVSGASGEINSFSVEREENASGFRVTDDRGDVSPGPGCAAAPDRGVTCSSGGVTAIAVTGGDLNDALFIGPDLPPVSFSGGSGRDQIAMSGPVLLDGVANDGPSGKDDIADDVEVVYGTSGADRVVGGSSSLLIDLGDGDDDITGGSGNDRIKGATVEDVGVDIGNVYTLGRDKIACGAGKDQVFVDPGDTVASDCEVIGRPTNGGARYTGSSGADIINIDEYVRATVHGRGGNDLIQASAPLPASGDLLIGNPEDAGSGDGDLFGDGGNDTIIGDPGGTDSFSGGSGNDRITSRDGNKETVRCGSGRDVVTADRKDRVARDCERVRLPARHPSCARAGSRTLDQNRGVRLYHVRAKDGSDTLYACRRSDGKRFRLTQAFDDGVEVSSSYNDTNLSGGFVAWSEETTDQSCKADCPPGYEPTTHEIGVFDVRHGRRRSIPSQPDFGALVLTADGAVAWIVKIGENEWEVRASSELGQNRLLDRGDINVTTLELNGRDVISWMHGLEERFARI